MQDTLSLIDGIHESITAPRSVTGAIGQVVVCAPQVVAATKKTNGVVYTPTILADYVASKALQFLLQERVRADRDAPAGLTQLRVLDPACGDGELLCAVWRQLAELLPQYGRTGLSVDMFDPAQMLCGIDMDPAAVRVTVERLRTLSARSVRAECRVTSTNALFPFGDTCRRRGWQRVCRSFDAADGFDVIVANPPWGADVSAYRNRFLRGGYSLFRGQFDTADLFMELALDLLKPGGFLAFIVPDSLFNTERLALREMLWDRTEIRFIGRFGERIFDNVNRACAVIICRKGRDNPDSRTECFRLTPALRKQILSGRLSFSEAEDHLKHSVPQSRFRGNPECLFDIDVAARDEAVLSQMRKHSATFADYLVSARGVELSKHGKVVQCQACLHWLPVPTGPNPKCTHCSAAIAKLSQYSETIVSPHSGEGFRRFLVGESVCRYAIRDGYWIDVTRRGINYKDDEIYGPPKLLVRKTGVGINAAIDYSDALTNQVVYIFRSNNGLDGALPLEFFLGVLNSRMMYYFLAKTAGETEWRSHPYLTQKQVLELPLPEPDALHGNMHDAVISVATAIHPHATANRLLPPEVDAYVERQVAQLYQLGKDEYTVIYETLDAVQDLLPVRALKHVTIDDIFPIGSQ